MLQELLVESEPYGTDLSMWRRTLEERKSSVLQAAREALASLRTSDDYPAARARPLPPPARAHASGGSGARGAGGGSGHTIAH